MKDCDHIINPSCIVQAVRVLSEYVKTAEGLIVPIGLESRWFIILRHSISPDEDNKDNTPLSDKAIDLDFGANHISDIFPMLLLCQSYAPI